MGTYFDRSKLLWLTAAIVIAGLALNGDDDTTLLVWGVSGVIYTVVLYLSLKTRTSIFRFILCAIALGLCNIGASYSGAFLVAYLKVDFMLLFYVVPSILGGLLTFSALNVIWGVKYISKYVSRVILIVTAGSAISTYLLYFVKVSSQHYSLQFSISSIVWWICFTIGLALVEISINQQGQADSKLRLP